MGYNSNIPQSTSKRAVSQQQILINFQSIYNVFANNHVPLGLGMQGRHVVLILRDQTVTGNPTTSSSQIAIYQKLVAGVPNWFYRPNNNQTPIQMSYPSIGVSRDPAQYSFSAGPFVIYGGKVTNPTNGQTVTLSPNTTIRYVGLSVSNYKGFNVNFLPVAIPTNIVANSFNISFPTKPSGTIIDVYYIAIGN